MISLQFVFILALGAVAGWFAGQITGHKSKGFAVDMLIGVVGAALATLVLPDFVAWGRLPAMFAGAVFFASLILLITRFYRKVRIERRRGLPSAIQA